MPTKPNAIPGLLTLELLQWASWRKTAVPVVLVALYAYYLHSALTSLWMSELLAPSHGLAGMPPVVDPALEQRVRDILETPLIWFCLVMVTLTQQENFHLHVYPKRVTAGLSRQALFGSLLLSAMMPAGGALLLAVLIFYAVLWQGSLPGLVLEPWLVFGGMLCTLWAVSLWALALGMLTKGQEAAWALNIGYPLAEGRLVSVAGSVYEQHWYFLPFEAVRGWLNGVSQGFLPGEQPWPQGLAFGTVLCAAVYAIWYRAVRRDLC